MDAWLSLLVSDISLQIGQLEGLGGRARRGIFDLSWIGLEGVLAVVGARLVVGMVVGCG